MHASFKRSREKIGTFLYRKHHPIISAREKSSRDPAWSKRVDRLFSLVTDYCWIDRRRRKALKRDTPPPTCYHFLLTVNVHAAIHYWQLSLPSLSMFDTGRNISCNNTANSIYRREELEILKHDSGSPPDSRLFEKF